MRSLFLAAFCMRSPLISHSSAITRLTPDQEEFIFCHRFASPCHSLVGRTAQFNNGRPRGERIRSESFFCARDLLEAARRCHPTAHLTTRPPNRKCPTRHPLGSHLRQCAYACSHRDRHRACLYLPGLEMSRWRQRPIGHRFHTHFERIVRRL